MNSSILFCVLALLCVAQVYAMSTEEVAFGQFMATFGKSYTGKEYTERLQVFKDNLQVAKELNARDEHVTFGVTKFMDLTPDEFRATYLLKNFTGLEGKTASNKWTPPPKQADYPSSWDWSSRGVVTGVYNQGQCGSCWAFSTTENIESMYALAGGGLHNLAMQQIVDCDHSDGGCNGGNPPTAYEYVISAGGLDSYNSYPYTGVQGSCRFNPGAVTAKISSWQWITENDNEGAMQAFVANNGPPSICVDATIWQYYTGGIVTTASGCGNSLDHCVQLTGWQEADNMMVWNVRNSWGTDWGQSGYIFLEAGYNVCGIGQEVSSSIA